jgi:DNA anti-recombination protein RmuC
MSDSAQGALVHEMLGRFIEEAVSKAVRHEMDSLAEKAQETVKGVIEAGAAHLAKALEGSEADFQTRIRKMVAQGMATLSAEAERFSQQIREESARAVEDLPVAVQGPLLQMTQESEKLFHRRADDWMEQFQAEQTAELSEALQALRQSVLEDVAQSAKGLCDRNLIDFRSEFENHVNRCFQGAAERLTAPLQPFSQGPSPASTMRQ